MAKDYSTRFKNIHSILGELGLSKAYLAVKVDSLDDAASIVQELNNTQRTITDPELSFPQTFVYGTEKVAGRDMMFCRFDGEISCKAFCSFVGRMKDVYLRQVFLAFPEYIEGKGHAIKDALSPEVKALLGIYGAFDVEACKNQRFVVASVVDTWDIDDIRRSQQEQ